MSLPNTTYAGLANYSESTEYGAARTVSPVLNQNYTWLGAKRRSADTLGSLTLMGARLYNPGTGRFLSRDPIPGGNDNPYTYPVDPINQFDTDGLSVRCFCGYGGPTGWGFFGKGGRPPLAQPRSLEKSNPKPKAAKDYRKKVAKNKKSRNYGETVYQTRAEAEKARYADRKNGGRCRARDECKKGGHLHLDYFTPDGKLMKTKHYPYSTNKQASIMRDR